MQSDNNTQSYIYIYKQGREKNRAGNVGASQLQVDKLNFERD